MTHYTETTRATVPKNDFYQANTSLTGRMLDKLDKRVKLLGESTRAPLIRAAIDMFLDLPRSKNEYWIEKVKMDLKRERDE